MMLAATTTTTTCMRIARNHHVFRQTLLRAASSSSVGNNNSDHHHHHSSTTTTTTTTNLIINAVGKDRLGIVSDITGLVISNGGNVGESQAAKLGTHFSLMMLVSIPTTTTTKKSSSSSENNIIIDDLKTKLANMPDMNATVFETKDPIDSPKSKIPPQIGYSGYFTLEGADNPGIVHKITTSLTKHGLSIDKLETDYDIAPYGGVVLFKMRGIANAAAPLAAGFNIERIKMELYELGEALNCDINMEDMDDSNISNSSSSYLSG